MVPVIVVIAVLAVFAVTMFACAAKTGSSVQSEKLAISSFTAIGALALMVMTVGGIIGTVVGGLILAVVAVIVVKII